MFLLLHLHLACRAILHVYCPKSAQFLHFLMHHLPPEQYFTLYSAWKLPVAVCSAEPWGELIYLKPEFIQYTVIRTVGEPWGGSIPSTIKSRMSQWKLWLWRPKKGKLCFFGSYETAMCLTTSWEIHNSHIKKVDLGEDNFSFLNKLKAFCLCDKHVLSNKNHKTPLKFWSLKHKTQRLCP